MPPKATRKRGRASKLTAQTHQLRKKLWARRVERHEARTGAKLTVEEKDTLRVVKRKFNGISVYPHCKNHWSRDINASCNFSYGVYIQ
jgi:hypothetical protein